MSGGIFEGIGSSVGGVIGGGASGVVRGLPGGIAGGITGGAAGAGVGAAAGATVGAVGGLGVGDVATIPAGAGVGAVGGGFIGSAAGAGAGFAPGFSQGYGEGYGPGAAIGGGYGQALDDTWLGKKLNAMVKGNEQADKKGNDADQKKCGGNCEKNTNKNRKSAEDVLSDATRDPDKPTLGDGTEQYNKPGGMPEADQDFDSMDPKNVQGKGSGVRTGELSDGTEVVVRPKSVPSVEINPIRGTPKIIRYK